MKELKDIETLYWEGRRKKGIKRDVELIEKALKENPEVILLHTEKLDAHQCGRNIGCAALFSIAPKTELARADDLNNLLKKKRFLKTLNQQLFMNLLKMKKMRVWNA